jgi:hypothetical protein
VRPPLTGRTRRFINIACPGSLCLRAPTELNPYEYLESRAGQRASFEFAMESRAML